MEAKKCIITIAEPWDFTSPDGDNVIVGHILREIDGHAVIFKSRTKQNFRSVIGDIFVLTPRQKGADLLNLTSRISVNAGTVSSDRYMTMDLKSLKEQAKFVFIGDIQRTD